MADNVVLNPGSGGPSVRTLDRGDLQERQVVVLDLGGKAANAENLITIGQQNLLSSMPTTEAWDRPYSNAEMEIIGLLKALVNPSGNPIGLMSPFQDLGEKVRNSLIEVLSNFNYQSGVAPAKGALNVNGAASEVLRPVYGRPFNLSGWGTFSATVQLERTFDNGSTWLPMTQNGVPLFVFTAPFSEVWQDDEIGVLYRLHCTAYVSGTILTRLSC